MRFRYRSMVSAFTLLSAAFGAFGTASCALAAAHAVAKSPDGKNEIRLYVNPLGYEVLRGGRTLIVRTPISLTVDGVPLGEQQLSGEQNVVEVEQSGSHRTKFYKKSEIDLHANLTYADFGGWGVRLVARNDGVAYRFELKRDGEVTVNGERADLTVADPDLTAYVCRSCQSYHGDPFQNSWESVNDTLAFKDIVTDGKRIVYLPLVLKYADGTALCVTESDLRDYPGWNFHHDAGSATLTGRFACAPAKLDDEGKARRRHRRVESRHDYLVKTPGTHTFPWRTFILADDCSKLCEADIVAALAAKPKGDFSWVRPGFVAWDWWNAWENQGGKGCNTKTYERFIDFAATNGIPYVIFDEGWSEKLNIWKYHRNVDVPHLVKYADQKGVGIILWMAWAQLDGCEEKVARHFSQLGVKGFKIDFMDRDDADCVRFIERVAKACAECKLIVDFHGMYKPTGMEITWPNIVNFEGVRGLENMRGHKNDYDFMASDIKSFFVRLTAGPMDYTPGAMDNYPVRKYAGNHLNPGSCGTRCRQLAMISLYFAPLQMLCDAPSKYERNPECLKFMAATPLVWDDTRGLPGDPDSLAACARRSGDVWYAAGITGEKPCDYVLDTAFLGTGDWSAEIFRDADDADVNPTHYVRETKTVKAGDKLPLRLAPGGGFAVRFQPFRPAKEKEVVEGTHGYTPKGYITPAEPEVRERLEWFRDQKLALMIHFGMYSQLGIIESWALSDKDAYWSRVQVDWTDDGELFKRQYWNLWKTFNPIRFQPERWAALAKENGFRYVIFTTKHHDGFCMYDSKYSDFKITNPECPFSSNPKADVTRQVFDAFRVQGLGIAAYFSKPDWHHPDFWDNQGMGRFVTRRPTYSAKEHPERWARFREYTKNQIVELVRDYGPVDIIWLDGGWISRGSEWDIGIEDIIATARKYRPGLISVDRTCGGTCENVITPEETVPEKAIDVPWESCITMGPHTWAYRYDDEYRSPRELIHHFIDIVAKGGNLALNIGPSPIGRIPDQAIRLMEEMGTWLKANGEGIYGTRAIAPYKSGSYRFTTKDGNVYAFILWTIGQRGNTGLVIPAPKSKEVKRVVHLASGREIKFTATGRGLAIHLPPDLLNNPYADGFRLEY